MPRKARKKAAAVATAPPSEPEEEDPNGTQNGVGATQQFAERQLAFNNREVERRTAAIQAICVAETENLLSRLRLLRSYISKEQLETPALKFFQENLPNISAVRNEKYQIFELQWNLNTSFLFGNQNDVGYPRVSIANTDNMSDISRLQFSVDSVKKNILEAANYQIPGFVFGEPSENQVPGRNDAYQTPGAMSHRLSFGMTPKTLRLPKNGEVILSVHGSPLGVYNHKEENLAAIRELGDGSGCEDAD